MDLAKRDPTDHALATIASILDLGDSRRTAEKPVRAKKAPAPAPEPTPVREPAPVPEDADGYCKVGPGPMEAIRFKWTVRRADGDQYFVDETIGGNSTAIVSGPMDREAAIRFVDDRENDARKLFEQLRHEMAGRAVALDAIRKNDPS